MPTVNYSIANTNDDVRDRQDGLALNAFAAQGTDGSFGAVGGFRFLSVAVPAGATITSATLTLYRFSVTGSAWGTLKGIAADTVAAWSITNRPGSLTKTTATVTVSNATNPVIYNVTSIVAEIIGRAGWVSGNNLAFGGVSTGSNGLFEWHDYADGVTNSAKLAITYTAGGTAYTLTADTGSYSLSGQAANLTSSRKITADVGAYALTGNAANLVYTVAPTVYTLTADTGSYSLFGNDAGLNTNLRMLAATGSYSLTGNATGLTSARRMLAAVGSYAITGRVALFPRARTMLAATGTYSLSGQATSFYRQSVIALDSGSYSLTGNDAGIVYAPGSVSYTLTANTGFYALSGNPANLSRGYTIQAQTGSYALTGNAATFVSNKRLTAESGVYSLIGNPANLLYGQPQPLFLIIG